MDRRRRPAATPVGISAAGAARLGHVPWHERVTLGGTEHRRCHARPLVQSTLPRDAGWASPLVQSTRCGNLIKKKAIEGVWAAGEVQIRVRESTAAAVHPSQTLCRRSADSDLQMIV